jgi:hypothetical protein
VNGVTKDPLAVGIGALATGVGLGGACVTLTVLVARALQRVEIGRYGESVSTIDPVWGVAAGIVVSTLFGWGRSRPLENLWQRGVISVLSVFGALFLAIIAAPVWHFFRFAGLLGLTIVSLGLGIAGSRWAARGSGAEEARSGMG